MAFLQSFPNFNLYSMPLIILVGQGYLFALILFLRFSQKRKTSDFLLATLLVITGIRCTAYMIGFMGWYDDYPNTKINYFLIDFSLILGPLIYYYVKSITTPKFAFSRRDVLHAIPWVVFLSYRTFIYVYDSNQPGFDEVQNGVLHSTLAFEFGYVFYVIGIISRLIYFYLAIKTYYLFRKKIGQFFSNTYKVELSWLRNFLLTYSFLFLLRLGFNTVNEYIISLSWTQNWWWYFVASLVLVYLGMMGIFSDVGKLSTLEFVDTKEIENPEEDKELISCKEKIQDLMEGEKLFLNPDLTLSELSKLSSIPSNQLSRVINTGFGKNFNDFINEFRIEEVKQVLKDPGFSHLSILGIALDCGFNSKATFNRVFKKLTGYSPSEFQALEKNN